MTIESTRHTSGGTHTRLVNTAADVISRAMQQGRTLPAALAVALDSAQLLQSPDTAAEFEKLLRWHDEDGKAIDAATRLRDELRSRITTLEADREANDREYEAATARIAELESERHATNEALDDVVQALRARETSPLTVFRASHDSIVMGLYTTATEARAHCVAEERRAWSKSENPVFDWIEDEEDGTAELVTVDENCEPGSFTGYVVTALEVATAYDGEADE